jgi:hypothetical protein
MVLFVSSPMFLFLFNILLLQSFSFITDFPKSVSNTIFNKVITNLCTTKDRKVVLTRFWCNEHQLAIVPLLKISNFYTTAIQWITSYKPNFLQLMMYLTMVCAEKK